MMLSTSGDNDRRLALKLGILVKEITSTYQYDDRESFRVVKAMKSARDWPSVVEKGLVNVGEEDEG